MKITCGKSELLTGINIALKAVPSKTTLPILESFLITADENIQITTNDKDMGIETSVEGDILEAGKIAVDARLFSEIVRKLPENDVYIESENDTRVTVRCEDSVFTLGGRNPDEFPELPETADEKRISLSLLTLKDIIRQTIFSIAAQETNSVMRGELFEAEDNILKVVSLDSHRISIRRVEMSESFDSVKAVVPGKTLNEIMKIISGSSDEMAEIVFDNNFVKFSFEGTMVISRLIEGEFFNVEQMISSDYETEISVNRNDFLSSLDRAMTLIREGDKKPVILDIRQEEMLMDITTQMGSMNCHVPVVMNGKQLTIGFNPKFLIEALRVIDDEEVSIYFVNSSAPCFIRNNEGDYIYIILPVNINR